MPRPYRPRIPRREMTSDSPRRKKQSRKSIKTLMSTGYRGNPRDNTESMYLKSYPRSVGSLASGASSNTSGSRRRRGRTVRAY